MKNKMIFLVLAVVFVSVSFATNAFARLDRKKDANGVWQLYDEVKQITFIVPYTRGYVKDEDKENFGVIDVKTQGPKDAIFLFRDQGFGNGPYNLNVYYLNQGMRTYTKLFEILVPKDETPILTEKGTFVIKSKTVFMSAHYYGLYDTKISIQIIKRSTTEKSPSTGKIFRANLEEARRKAGTQNYDEIVWFAFTDIVKKQEGMEQKVGSTIKYYNMYLIDSIKGKTISASSVDSDGNLREVILWK